jgi:hypothetical protein
LGDFNDDVTNDSAPDLPAGWIINAGTATANYYSTNRRSDSPIQSSATQDSAPLPTSEDTEMVSSAPLDESAEKMITLIKQHLAQNLGIAVDQIVVSDVKSVRWRDAGLGCPKRGVDYIQVETPGYSVFLQADGKTYNYHTDEVKRFVLCKF